MKGLLIALLLLSARSWATCSLLHSGINTACTSGSSTCAVTMTSTTAGSFIVTGVEMFGTSNSGELITSVADDKGSTYGLCAASGCHSTQSTTRSADIAYGLSTIAAATTLTVTRTSTLSSTWKVHYAEYSCTVTPVSVDRVGVRTQGSGANPLGVALTPGGANDVIYQIALLGGTVTAISAPYTDPGLATSAGYAWAGAVNQSSGAAPTWTNTSNPGAFSAIAIKEFQASSSTQVGAFLVQ